MKLFKRRNSIKKRLETLESYLGVFYVVDSDNYAEYKRDEPADIVREEETE